MSTCTPVLHDPFFFTSKGKKAMNYFYDLISPAREVRAAPVRPKRPIEEDWESIPSDAAEPEARSSTLQAPNAGPVKSTEDVGSGDVIPRSPWKDLQIQPKKTNRYAMDKGAFKKLLQTDPPSIPDALADNMYLRYWTDVFRKAGLTGVAAKDSSSPEDHAEWMGLFDQAFRFKGMDMERDVARVKALSDNSKVQQWSAAMLRPGSRGGGGRPRIRERVREIDPFQYPLWAAVMVITTAAMMVIPRQA